MGYTPRESSIVDWYILRHGGEITCEITGRRRRSDVDGKDLEVPFVYTSLGRRLSSKPQQSQKISQNAARQSMSISWNRECRT